MTEIRDPGPRKHRRRVPTTDRCTVDGCTKDAEAWGLCHGHYQRWQRHGDVQADRPLGRQDGATCSVAGCESRVKAQDLCSTHYSRLRLDGDAAPARPIRRVNGKGYVHHGYFVVPVSPDDRHLSGGRATYLEHRLVMARALGRALTDDESVHHKNGDRLDNRLENLELWSRWQPSGQKVADKVAWAIELLSRYRPELLSAETSHNGGGTPNRI